MYHGVVSNMPGSPVFGHTAMSKPRLQQPLWQALPGPPMGHSIKLDHSA